MITRNMDIFKKLLLTNDTKGNLASKTCPKMTDISGTEYTAVTIYVASSNYGSGCLGYLAQNFKYDTSDSYFGGNLCIGSSTQAPSYEDFKLYEPIDETKFDRPSQTCIRTVEGDKIVLLITRTFSALEDFTVNEIAYVKTILLGGGARNVVLAREVLPTPKQVSAGETFTVSMVIEM